MAIPAKAVEVLIQKGRFTPDVAVAIGEAVDMTIAAYQLGTVPVLDMRLAELRAEFLSFRADVNVEFSKVRAEMATLRAELVRWVFLVMLGNVALTAGVTAILNYLQRM